ncbi:MAG: dimethyl sulfoxide reductase anchor subunit family protein, partial [Limisphaerales bacterium]
VPTTRYKSEKKLPATLQAGDFHELKPQPLHSPLIFMLVLTQLSVGTFCFDFLLSKLFPSNVMGPFRSFNLVAALLFGYAGLSASVFHLGRPLQAWKSFLGLKKSWLSREIVAFAIFALLASLYVGGFLAQKIPANWINGLGISVIVTGLLALFCSMMIYHDTRREFWRWPVSGAKFFGTTLLLGATTVLISSTVSAVFASQQFFIFKSLSHELSKLVLLISLAKLAGELLFFRHLRHPEYTALKRSALLMTGVLSRITLLRYVGGAVGGILLPVIFIFEKFKFFSPMVLVGFAGVLWVFCIIGELLERTLFFRAVAPSKMPGGVSS